VETAETDGNPAFWPLTNNIRYVNTAKKQMLHEGPREDIHHQMTLGWLDELYAHTIFASQTVCPDARYIITQVLNK
jgi:hypothetical protein